MLASRNSRISFSSFSNIALFLLIDVEINEPDLYWTGLLASGLLQENNTSKNVKVKNKLGFI